MPRKNLIRTDILPYHITTRSNNKEWFDIPIQEVWEICKSALEKSHKIEPVDLISFVLMSNHYHLILKTPLKNLDRFMYFFNKELSLKLRERTERINHMFGGRYKWCLISSVKYFANCYRYVYQNPIRAGISHACERYPYSTLFYIHHKKDFPIPIIDHYGFLDYYKLDWLNDKVSKEEQMAIKNGLYRSELKALKHPVTRKYL